MPIAKCAAEVMAMYKNARSYSGRSRLPLFVVKILVAVTLASAMYAQNTPYPAPVTPPPSGSLHLEVAYEGKPVTDAAVVIRNEQGKSITVHTDDAGACEKEFLGAGMYSVTVSAAGFNSVAKQLEIKNGKKTTWLVHLTK